MAKKQEKVEVPAPQLPPIPYFSQWDNDNLGRPVGLVNAIIKMLMTWVGRTHAVPAVNPSGMPGPITVKEDIDKQGTQTTLQHPLSCIHVLPGDVCLIDYAAIPRQYVQDVNFKNWSWVVFLGHDDKTAWINDPNWSGDRRDEGNALALPLYVWELAFRPNTTGYTCIRLNVPGPAESIVDYHAPLTDEDREHLVQLAAIYGSDDQPDVKQPKS